jgi:hypothetical protein
MAVEFRRNGAQHGWICSLPNDLNQILHVGMIRSNVLGSESCCNLIASGRQRSAVASWGKIIQSGFEVERT